jgi:diguanylate cyclase (GGDEF)-like protein/PAS domain S-box-containing protein
MSAKIESPSTAGTTTEITTEITTGSKTGIAAKDSGRRDIDRFFTLSLQLLMVAGLDGHILRCNPAWQEALGWDLDELIGSSFFDLVHPDDLEATRAEARGLAEGERTQMFVNRYRCRDGSWRDLAWSATAAPEDGLIYAIAHDITEQKRAMRTLRDNEQRLREAERVAGLGSWELDLVSKRLFWSDQIYRLLRLERKDVEPSYDTFLELVHPDDRETVDRVFWGAVNEGSLYSIEHRLLIADGTLLWVHERGEIQYAADGTPRRVIGTAQNITERQQSRLMLALQARRDQALLKLPKVAETLDEQAMLQEALRLTADLTQSAVAFAHYVDADRASVDLAAWTLPGLDANAALGRDLPERLSQADLWADALRERAPVIIQGDAAPVSDQSQSQTPGALCRRLVAPVIDGGRVTLLFGVGDKPGRYDQIDVDSVQLLANEAWRLVQRVRVMAQLTLADQVLADTRQGLAITDADANLIRVNAAFTAITGYSADEVLGRNPRLLQSGRHDAAFYRAMWAALSQDGSWRGEIWNRRKDGEVYPQWLSVSAVCDSNGRVGHYVGLFNDLSESKLAQEKIDFLSRHDALTGLANRTLFNERLEHALARGARNGRVAVLYLDLDGFKQVNDTLGHEDGDRLLVEVARRVAAELLPSDTLARLGSDEFALLLEERAEARSVAALAGELLQRIAKPVALDSRELVVTACIGISLYPEDGGNGDSLARHASHALGAAKRQNRNSFQFFDRSLTTGALERLITEQALRGAIGRHELCLAYQPQVRLADGELAAVEALLRWQHPELGLVPPSQFIPLAEDIGLINELGAWVLNAACAQVVAWEQQGFRVPRIAVNLSARQLDELALPGTVAAALGAHRLAADRLELEVTETMLMRHPEAACALLSKLKALGARISIDDFGTGYSSLAMLRLLPLDALKIDRSFVHDIGADHDDETIVRAIIAMARTLGLETVAEGVESLEQHRFLSREQVTLGQGYRFARPLSAEELPVWAERRARAQG